MITHPASSIELDPPLLRIELITVLQYSEPGSKESVCYDAALLFQQADGRRFSVAVHQSILGGLECCIRDELIDGLLEDYTIRLVLRKD